MISRKVNLEQRVLKMAKVPCTALVDGKHVCGDIWRTVMFKGRRRVSTVCYMHGHVQDVRGRALGPVQFKLRLRVSSR